MMAATLPRRETFRWQHKTFDITSLLQDLRSGAVCPEKIELEPAFIEGYCSLYLDPAGSSPRPPLTTNRKYADALLPEHLAKPILLLHVGEDKGLVSLREDHPEPHYVVADGNHRLLAARRLKMKAEAYVFSREQSNRYEQTPDA